MRKHYHCATEYLHISIDFDIIVLESCWRHPHYNTVKPSVQLNRARSGKRSITVCSRRILELLDVTENL